MDAARKSNRKFPSYTTDMLRKAVAEYEAGQRPEMSAANYNAVKAEIADRESGKSVPFVVPQVKHGVR